MLKVLIMTVDSVVKVGESAVVILLPKLLAKGGVNSVLVCV